MAQMNLPVKQKQTHRHREQTCDCHRRGGRELDEWCVGVGRWKLLHLDWISSEILLYSTGNCVQSLGIEHDGR